METSFDLSMFKPVNNPAKDHKKKPEHMASLAAGVKKRFEASLKHRKSCRLSKFDQGRDISPSHSPIKEVDDAKAKVEHRRQQLEKWKLLKAQKKKEQAAQKKKPFVAGIAHAPLKYTPPSPPKPTTAKRVTRATARRATDIKQPAAQQEAKPLPSFAPKNAKFKPPVLKNPITLPTITQNKPKPKTTITFNPIIPKPLKMNFTSSSEESSTMLNDNKTKRKFVKTPIVKFTKYVTSTSSDSDHSTKTNTSSKPPTKSQATKAAASVPTQPKVHPQKTNPKTVKESPQQTTRAGTRASKQKALAAIASYVEKKINKKTKTTQVINEEPADVTVDPVEKVKPQRKSISRKSANKTTLAPKEPVTATRQSKTPKESKPKKSLTKTTPKRPIPKSESSSEEKIKINSSKMIDTSASTPSSLNSSGIVSSPYVCMSRGKENARREMKEKADTGILAEYETDGEGDSVPYFRNQIDSVSQRIHMMCDEWEAVNEQSELPEFVQELILGNVGQGRLFVAQKLRQFAGLVERCAAHDPAVTLPDLRGVWDMIYLQVENIELRFLELLSLRNKNWSREEPAPRKPSPAPRASRPARPAPRHPARGGPSGIRDMINAARKAKKQHEESTTSASSTSSQLAPETPGQKTFDAGFFTVRSPVRSPASPSTPLANRSLLKSVLSSEARKASASKKSTTFAMLRASLLGKTGMEIEGVTPLMQTPKPLPPINLNATPARSILKSGTKQSVKKSAKKSIKTVLFDPIDGSSTDSSNNTISDSGMDVIEGDCHDKENEIINISDDIVEKTVNRPQLRRQSNMEYSPVMTRQRKSMINISESDSVLKEINKSATRKSLGRKSEAKSVDISFKSSISDVEEPKMLQRRSKRLTKLSSEDEDLISFDTPKTISRRSSKRQAV